jgi:hypothetical protein
MVIRDGLVVAEGTRDQLTRQLMGEPIWELRLAGPTHNIAQMLGEIVRVEASGADWVRYRCTDARMINPHVITRLAAHDVPVIALTELPRRLEDVYLSIVEAQSVDRGSWSNDVGDGGQAQRRGELRTGDGEQTPISHPPSPIPHPQYEEVQQ